MQRRPALIVSIWLGLLASSSEAVAAPSSPTSPGVATEAEPATDLEAKYAAAQERYAAGDLAGALHILQQCYAASHAKNLLFNLAQLYRELNDCGSALEYYQRYVEEVPDGERRADALRYVESLRGQCATTPSPAAEVKATTPLPQQSPTPTPAPLPAPQSTNYWPTVGWIAVGTSAVATAATVYFALQTHRARDDIERLGSSRSFSISELTSSQDDFYRNRNWAFAMGAVAVATAGFGACALIIAAPQTHGAQQSLAVTALAGGASVGYRLRF